MLRSSLNLLMLAAVGLMAGGCEIHAQSLGVDGSFDRTLQVEGPLDLDVLSRSGHILVKVGSPGSVHITGRIRAYGSLPWWTHGYSATEQARLLETTPPIDQSGNRIDVGYISDEALASNVTISYDVTVPSNTRLRTSSRSGDTTVDAIQGPVTASSRSGRIHVGSVPGDLDVDSRSGDIELLDQRSNVRVVSRSGRVTLEGQPSRTWAVQTRSGDIEVALPQDGGAEIDVDSRSGSVDSSRPIERRSSKSRNHTQGIVGRGTGRLEVTTRSGSVRIR
jgi:putative adhesin